MSIPVASIGLRSSLAPAVLQRSACHRGVMGIVISLFAGCGTPYSSREHLTLTAEVAGADTLVLRNPVGPVTLTADPDAADVRAEIVKIGKGSSPREADAALAQIEVRLGPSADRPEALEAAAQHPRGSPTRNYEIEWRITAPPEIALDIYSSVGALSSSGFMGPAAFKTDVGEIDVRGAHTQLSAITDVGDVYAESAGRIEVRTDVGDAHVRVLPGDGDDIRARTSVGELLVELPPGRSGHLKAGAGVGSLRIQLDSLNLGGGKVRDLSADLGGATSPVVELATDVGDLTVRSLATISAEPPAP